MIKRFSALIFLSFHLITGAQNWAPVSKQKFAHSQGLEFVLQDSIHSEIIVTDRYMYQVGNLPVRGVARWNGFKWDSLAGGINTHDKNLNPNYPGAQAYCGTAYNGKFLVGGNFYSMGGINATGLALWDGVKWDSLPKKAFRFGKPLLVNALYRKGTDIYIGGGFDTIAGQKCSSLGKWDGTNFIPFILPVSADPNIEDIIEFQNEIYISGNFDGGSSSNPYNRILKFNGSSWITVGGGINGGIGEVRTMKIYNNELYVGGLFLKSAGNAGENVMKWDGSQWHDVGFDGGNFGTVRRLVVHNNKLWAFGNYATAGSMAAFGVAVYDGTKWCALQDTINGFAEDAVIFKDTIFVVGNFLKAGNDTNCNFIAKIRDENTYRQCKIVGIKENPSLIESVSIFPNPVLNILHIESEQYFEAGTEIEITNTLGQTVLKLLYNNEIDVSSISNGCYFLNITTNNNQSFHSKFIKE